MKAYNLNKAAKRIGVPTEDCIDYLKIRQYIYPGKKGYRATAMGVEFGYTVNINKQACLTVEGMSKVATAFISFKDAIKEGKRLIAKHGISI